MLNEYLSWNFTDVRVRAMASTTGKRDPLALLRLLRCVVRILSQRMSRRPSAFVVHMSDGGSFIREGALAALARLCRFPTAIHLHGSEFVEFAARWPRLVRAVLGLAHKVYVLTAESRGGRTSRPRSAREEPGRQGRERRRGPGDHVGEGAHHSLCR